MYTIVNVCSGFVTLFLQGWVERQEDLRKRGENFRENKKGAQEDLRVIETEPNNPDKKHCAEEDLGVGGGADADQEKWVGVDWSVGWDVVGEYGGRSDVPIGRLCA